MANINFGQILGSPIFLGVLGFLGIIIFVFCAFGIYLWLKGGKGRFTKTSTRYQKCLAITASNKVVYRLLKVIGNYVMDEAAMTWHVLDPDALIPNLTTGEYYLPIDSRDAIPLFPLKPELREGKVKALAANIGKMAKECRRAKVAEVTAQIKKEEDEQRRNFALLAAFGILALLVIGVMVKQFMG